MQYNAPLATAEAGHNTAVGIDACVVHLFAPTLNDSFTVEVVCGLALLMLPAM
jgi:hypothetical protein